MKLKDIAQRLDLQDERFNLINERLNLLSERLDKHDSNHHGKKSTVLSMLTSGTGAVVLLGIIQGLLSAFGVSLGFP